MDKNNQPQTQALAPVSDQEDDELQPQELDRLSLPKDKELPPIIRTIVGNAPPQRKLAAFLASISPLCALASRIRLKYFYDSRPSALLLQVLIEGAQSAGKSFAADIESLIMKDTLKARDKEQRRKEQEYREKKKRRKANERLEEEPQTTIRVIPATISKTVLTKRADFYERILGDTMTFWMFAEELAQVTDAGKQGYSNLRTIMRTAYDLGSLFGIDYASDNSYSAIVDINICSMFCATPSAVDEYYDKKAIEGGNITRCIICNLDDEIGADGARFQPYTEEQRTEINGFLNRMMADTYTKEGALQPTRMLDMSWLDRDCRRWCKRKGKEASLTGSSAIDVFRKRSSVSAFRTAALCYYLYGMDKSVSEEYSQKLCRKIYYFMAEFILAGMMRRWGRKFEELNAKRNGENQPEGERPKLFDLLSSPFTRDQLKLLVKQQELSTPARVFLSQWKRMKVITEVGKDTFEKV